jgi:hypothetical protein
MCTAAMPLHESAILRLAPPSFNRIAIGSVWLDGKNLDRSADRILKKMAPYGTLIARRKMNFAMGRSRGA